MVVFVGIPYFIQKLALVGHLGCFSSFAIIINSITVDNHIIFLHVQILSVIQILRNEVVRTWHP